MIFYLLSFLVLVFALFLKFVKIPKQNADNTTLSNQSMNKYDTEKLARFMGDYSIGLSLIFFIIATVLLLMPQQNDLIIIVGLIVTIVYLNLGLLHIKTSKKFLNQDYRLVEK